MQSFLTFYYTNRRFIFSFCLVFCPCAVSRFSIAITLLEAECLGAFRAFVCFALAGLYLFNSSPWCQGLSATCYCGTPWMFPFTF